MHYQPNGKKIEPMLYPANVDITVHPGKGWRKSDLDNRIKPIMDQLQHCGYLAGDDTDCVRRISIQLGDRLPVGEESYVMIDITNFGKGD